jgi:hypothetical protein
MNKRKRSSIQLKPFTVQEGKQWVKYNPYLKAAQAPHLFYSA